MFDRLLHPELILYSLPGIIIGLVLHELAHALVADKLGDPTPRMMGRITLNPLPHIDPVGFAMLILVGFGWAKPVMTNPAKYKVKRFGLAMVGIAGPLTNLLLGFVFILLFLVVGTSQQYSVTDLVQYGYLYDGQWLMNILVYAIQINFALFLFNLIPIPPLDGYNILKDLVLVKHMKSQALWNFERYGQFLLIAILFIGVTGTVIGFVNQFLWNGGMSIFSRFFM